MSMVRSAVLMDIYNEAERSHVWYHHDFLMVKKGVNWLGGCIIPPVCFHSWFLVCFFFFILWCVVTIRVVVVAVVVEEVGGSGGGGGGDSGGGGDGGGGGRDGVFV